MKWSSANSVVEELRRETRLYLPALSARRGFSSSRVEHLLSRLVSKLPEQEAYLEVGTLEGRTLEAASIGNPRARIYGCDHGRKYEASPEPFLPHVRFFEAPWQAALLLIEEPIGIAFYDGDHDASATEEFMAALAPRFSDEAVLVLDDWDRASVRDGAFAATEREPRWRLLREMPEYGDGLTCPAQNFGWYFGVSLWGFKR